MKIGVIKLGARISFSSQGTSGGNGEACSVINMLRRGGADVDIFTKILKKDVLHPDYAWHNLSDEKEESLHAVNNCDALVVLNGTVQFYGGVEDREQLLNYFLVNNYKGPVFYILCDPELTFGQVWPSVSKKPWASNWTESQLNVTRKDITYISQPYDVDRVFSALNKNEIIPSSIVHFPFEQFPCMHDVMPVNPSPTVDLSYGGTMRGGRRMKKMVKFYFGHPEEISVEMFGKIESSDFDKMKGTPSLPPGTREPLFTGPVQYDQMLNKMNNTMAHCVIGDPWYAEIKDLPQRIYESIMSNVVTFVDSELDVGRRVYGVNKEIADFLYVNSREELSEKILLLKADNSIRLQILNEQIETVGFDANRYCGSFVDIIAARSETLCSRAA